MNSVPKETRRLLTLALGKSSQDVIATLDRWLRKSGTEWTSNRLKCIRVAALQLRGGCPEKAVEIYQKNSIAYHKGSKLPKGPYGRVVENFVRAKRPAAIRLWDATLRVYTSLRLHTLSRTQEEKSFTSISSEFGGDKRNLSSFVNMLTKFASEELKPIFPKLGVPDVGQLKGFTNCHRTIPVPEDISDEAYASTVTSLLTSVWIPPSLQDLNPCEELRQQLIADGAEADTAGHIAFIQEGGCKARVVAVPNAWCQWLFEPLHRSLDRLIRRLPNSAVHDQNEGGYYLQSHLREGVWCFDLSSATDRFPLPLQYGILVGLGLEEYGRAFIECSRGRWLFGDEKVVKWGIGQPMGLYGSFPLFHLTHWALLQSLCRIAIKNGVHLSETPFYVLGDDVIITNHYVAKMYEETMSLLDVPVSPVKTIESSQVGEFAGFVVTTTNRMVTAYRPYKYARQGRKIYPLNLMYSMSSKVKGLSHWWESTYHLFEKTLSSRFIDLSPIVPQDDQGGKTPASIDSHLLGSLANRIAYDLPFTPSTEFDALWRHHRYLLLGQKERLNSSGFAPKNLNPEGIGQVEKVEEDRNYANSRVWSDPLMRSAREQTNKPSEEASSGVQKSSAFSL